MAQNTPKIIDKSSLFLIDAAHEFYALTQIDNLSEALNAQFVTDQNYIQLFFNLGNECTLAFNMQHCAVTLQKNESLMVYFKEENTKIFFNANPDYQLISLFISVKNFHKLFTTDSNYLLNFDNYSLGRPILEKKSTPALQQVVLHQIIHKKENSSLHQLYLKGKFFELFSLYFDNTEENSIENCPFIANEETLSQLKKVKDIILDNMADPPSLEELSKTVGLNIKKLKQGFKEVYGAPVFTFLLNYKLEFAKKLLLENQFNVSEIGAKIGYSTSSHFISAFKSKYGITPKQFTKQL